MRLLRVLAVAAVDAGVQGHGLLAVERHRLLARRRDRLSAQCDRVGAHIGDEALLVQALGDAHRVLGAHRELATGLLLQSRGREGRLRAAGSRLGLERGDGCLADALDRCGESAGLGFVEDDDDLLQLTAVVEVGAARQRRAVDAGQAGGEGLGRLDGERFDVPIAGGDERHALTLAVDDHAGRGGLHATGAERSAFTAAADLAPQHGRDVPAVEAVEHAAGLLGIDEREVEFAGVVDRGADRVLGDLVEHHAVDGNLRLEHLEQVPGDRLALAVLICGQQDFVGGLERSLEFGDRLRLAVVDDVIGVEVVVDVDRVLAVRRLLVGRDVLLTREIANVPDRAQHLVIVAEVALDRLHLRR